MQHEIPENPLVDYQNNSSHSLETVSAVLVGMLGISCGRFPRTFRFA
jgi:hypothetical protein